VSLFDAYKNIFNFDIANDPNLEQALNLVAISGQRFPAKNVLAAAVPIMDAFELVHDHLITKNSNLKTRITLDTLLDNILPQGQSTITDTEITNIVDGVTKKIQSLLTTDPLDYKPSGTKTGDAHRTLTSEYDKLSQIAIEQLGRDTIQGALQKIITKRTTIANRLMAGKGIRKPFQTTFLVPLFDFYKNYTTGGGILYDRVTGDFKDAVDQLTIDKVIGVVISSGDYYLSLLRRQIGQQQASQQQQTSTPPQRGLTKDVYDGTTRSIGTAKLTDFRLFVNEGKSMWLPETQQQTTPVIYNLETISKDRSKEATNLYNALKDMAYYTRSTPGFKQRSQFAGQTASAITAAAGAKLYN
jgi:hypothetical protein